MAQTVSDLADKVELDLYLIVGYRGVLGSTDSVAPLLGCVEHAEVIADIL